MASRFKRPSILPTGALFGLLLGAVIIPAALAVSVGIVSLTLWRDAFDIVLGVLVLCFAAMALTGGILAIPFLRRSARLAEMQTDFIANVSHELRTPVAGIKLLVDTLTMGRATSVAQHEEVLAHMATEVRRLEDLVARILTWRRLEVGGLSNRALQPVDALIDEAVCAATGTFSQDAVTVHTHMAADDLEVHGERDALVDAFRNLVHNAIKFGGKHGPIEIVARRDGREIVVEFQDRGPGIPAAEQKRIFERFYRATVPDRAAQGTGLGLAIVRRVVDGHGGKLSVESDLGRGSVFMVRLPAASSPIRIDETADARPTPVASGR